MATSSGLARSTETRPLSSVSFSVVRAAIRSLRMSSTSGLSASHSEETAGIEVLGRLDLLVVLEQDHALRLRVPSVVEVWPSCDSPSGTDLSVGGGEAQRQDLVTSMP